MCSSFEKLWIESMTVNKLNQKNRLHLEPTANLRTKVIFQTYLDKIKNINKRTCFTRFRISAHELNRKRQIFSTDNSGHTRDD